MRNATWLAPPAVVVVSHGAQVRGSCRIPSVTRLGARGAPLWGADWPPVPLALGAPAGAHACTSSRQRTANVPLARAIPRGTAIWNLVKLARLLFSTRFGPGS